MDAMVEPRQLQNTKQKTQRRQKKMKTKHGQSQKLVSPEKKRGQSGAEQLISKQVKTPCCSVAPSAPAIPQYTPEKPMLNAAFCLC